MGMILGASLLLPMAFPQAVADPAPPRVRTLTPEAAPPARSAAGLTTHRAPRALAADAVVEEWPTFLGPRRDGHTRETPLDLEFGVEGPPLVWELVRGEGYASPVVVGERLVFTHRTGDQVHVDCLEATTGKRFWRSSIPCEYAGEWIKNSGPRATPAIAGEHVYVHGVDGVLSCLELTTGRVVWRRDTTTEFEVGHDFFGVVSSPLVLGDVLVQNVGAPEGPCVAAFDRATGKLVWGAGDTWGPSCASPMLATLGGRTRLCVVAGGESRPPTGGLLVLDPDTGGVDWTYDFRSRTFTSVNGATPVDCDERLFLTAAYGVGSALVEPDGEGGYRERWRERRGLALEFPTPIYEGGLVHAIDGVNGRAGAFVSVDPATGQERLRAELEFEVTVERGGQPTTRTAGVGAGSLLHAQGSFVALGDRGHLAVLRTRGEKLEVVSQASLFDAPEAWTPPVIVRGLLYVCQNNPARGGQPARLLCYDLRGGAR